MKYLGNIQNINGADIEPVDVIIGGSPCQDLSVAGKRAGLDGERSGLLLEQIRIIKEMRDATNQIQPRYAIWENVPGAFSSNNGEDFKIVLEEFAKIADENAVIPRPPKGKWRTSGIILGDGWSIAWRVLDAQYYGVPQRRRRISLIADFGGESAAEILFECESVFRDITEGRETGKRITESVERCVGEAKCIAFQGKAGAEASLQLGYDVSSTLSCTKEVMVCTKKNEEVSGVTYGLDSYNQSISIEVINPIRSASGGDTKPMIVTQPEKYTEKTSRNHGKTGGGNDVTSTLYAAYGTKWNGNDGAYNGDNFVLDSNTNQNIICFEPGALTRDMGNRCWEEKSPTLRADMGDNQPAIAFQLCGDRDNPSVSISDKAYCIPANPMSDRGQAICTQDNKSECCAVCYKNDNKSQEPVTFSGENVTSKQNKQNPQLGDPCHTIDRDSRNYICGNNYCVRRLTPLECERLQGYPDNWTDIPTIEITPDSIVYWQNIWTEWDLATGAKEKKRTITSIKKWMKKPTVDTARYKALGNSIALPPWRWIIRRMATYLPNNATLGSLFDGIGGFPLLWSEICGVQACRWASEIDPFCIAVTKYHFDNIVK